MPRATKDRLRQLRCLSLADSPLRHGSRLSTRVRSPELRGLTPSVLARLGLPAAGPRGRGALYVAKRKGRNRIEVAQELLVQAA